MVRILAVAAGGAVGSVARYLLAGVSQRWAGGTYPVGTLAVNVIGCLCIGLLAEVLGEAPGVRPEVRIAILVGVLGGFTTFSSFGYETLRLAEDGQYALAGLNVILNNGLGLTAAWLGWRLGKILTAG